MAICFYFISVLHFVMWVCNFVMPMLYFVMSFFYVVMWTNPSIISVTATPVGNVFAGTNLKKPGP